VGKYRKKAFIYALMGHGSNLSGADENLTYLDLVVGFFLGLPIQKHHFSSFF